MIMPYLFSDLSDTDFQVEVQQESITIEWTAIPCDKTHTGRIVYYLIQVCTPLHCKPQQMCMQ